MSILTILVSAMVALALLALLTEAFLGSLMAAVIDRRDAALVRARIAARNPRGELG